MRFLTLTTVSLFLSLCFGTNAFSQSRETKPTGSISGQVMLGDQPASGVTVGLTKGRQPTPVNTPLTQAVTDSEGRFHLTNIAAGVYNIAPLAPGFIVPNERSPFGEGRSVTVDEGEAVDGIKFSIKRGGVITGRITDENREPLVEIRVTLMTINERGQAQPFYVRNPFMSSTDDRGVYRIYGLPAGRYKISVGEVLNSHALTIGRANSPYQRTFHPDVMDESKAEIIELSEGGEAINVDISVNSKIKTYTVTGRVIHATTGKPISNVPYAYGTVVNSGPGGESYIGGSGFNGNRTNSRGEFRLEGVMPGRYAAFIVKEEGMELYAEPTVFEVKDANVGSVEVKAQSGQSISGVAVLEGATNASLMSALSQVYIFPQISPGALEPGFRNPSRISADGRFRISGLRAGKVRFNINNIPGNKQFTLLRVEQNGIEVKDGIAIKEGEEVTDVRLVFAYGSARIRGQVKMENGELPEGLGFMVMVGRIGAETSFQGRPVEVDGRGRFIIEELAAGEYELTLQPRYYQPPAPGTRPMRPVKKTVTITDGAEIQVNFTVDTGEKKEQQ
jgi:hypothetical protein